MDLGCRSLGAREGSEDLGTLKEIWPGLTGVVRGFSVGVISRLLYAKLEDFCNPNHQL